MSSQHLLIRNKMKIFYSSDDTFEANFAELLERGKMDIEGVTSIVSGLLKEIQTEGNKAVKSQIAKFDRWEPESDEALLVSTDDMAKAYDNIDPVLRDALHLAYDRIESYHQKLMPKTWMDKEANGTILGQKVTAVDRAGLYIPGGKAAYPSSLLMNVIPAQVAGVEEIVICTPAPDNELNELLLAACHLCKVTQVFRVGGASAIGAMAYGTETIPKVDVITGPGNIFVATAKKLLQCGFSAPADQGGEALMDIEVDGRKFSELLTDLVSKTGEKTEVGDFTRYTLSGTGVLGTYVHFNDKVGAMVEVEASSDEVAQAVKSVADGICMHITAMNPPALDRDSVDPVLIEKERAIAAEQVKDKPANIIDKIVDGKIGKFLKDICLTEQSFVKDDSKTVSQTLIDAAKAAGGEAKIKRFVRIEIG